MSWGTAGRFVQKSPDVHCCDGPRDRAGWSQPATVGLWRLLYETAARTNEILALDAEDLDLPNKRARVRSKGGGVEWVFWQPGAVLPRLLAGRATGPLLLADRRPTRAVPSVDRCPLTGRAR